MKRPNKREYQELLARYVEGKCSKQEKEALDRWYDSFDRDDTNDIDGTDTADLLPMKAEMFEHISAAIDQQELQTKGLEYAEKHDASVFRLTSLMHLAAVLVAGIVIGMAIFSQHFFSEARRVTSMKDSQREAEGPRRVNGPATIYLSDGSVVWLDSRSWLEHPGTFTGEMRAVILSGEAFFAVAKDSARPFVIHSTNFTTRVLGTSFKIKDHDHEESHEVEVVSGKVMVSVNTTTNSVKELILNSNRKAVYSKKNNSFVESRLQNEAAHALSANLKLEFNEVALADIVKVLNVVHGANITIANQGMNRCIITADLTNETLDVSIAILSKALNADVSVRGKEIILNGASCITAE